jgi:hypothetical protein
MIGGITLSSVVDKAYPIFKAAPRIFLNDIANRSAFASFIA